MRNASEDGFVDDFERFAVVKGGELGTETVHRSTRCLLELARKRGMGDARTRLSGVAAWPESVTAAVAVAGCIMHAG